MAERRAARLDRPAIREERLSGTLRAWRGLSGRRHVVTVMPFDAGAADWVGDGLAIAVRRDAAGLAHIVAIGGDTGLSAWWDAARAASATELHMHRLAGSADARAAIAMDLLPISSSL